VAAAVMEFTSKKKALLVLCFMLSCVLLPRSSSAAPLSSKQQPPYQSSSMLLQLRSSSSLAIYLCHASSLAAALFCFAGSLSLRNRQQPTNNPALEVPAQQVGRARSIAFSFCSLVDFIITHHKLPAQARAFSVSAGES